MSIDYANLTGQTFGRFTVLDAAKRPGKATGRHWRCRCECGNERIVSGYRLAHSVVVSCGCYRAQNTGELRRKHGHTIGGNSPTYESWRGMIDRCQSPSHEAYARYGGRGIKVCERWLDFANFLADMGARPAGLELDRKNNDGNYELSNCRWATRIEQMRHKKGLPFGSRAPCPDF